MCINRIEKKMNWKLLRGKSGVVSLSTGNKKLISSDETRFLIWSIPAVKTCPFRTKQCEKNCYARKAEKAYPGCIESRERNLAFTESEDFVPFMVDALHYIASLKNYRTAKHITVRIHESGDFYSLAYLKKWVAIAEACRDIPNIDFAAYTKSLPYLAMLVKEGYSLDKSPITFRSSIWADTKAERIEETKALNLPIYTAFAEENWPEEYTKCQCEDCGHCRKCFAGESKTEKIAVVIH